MTFGDVECVLAEDLARRELDQPLQRVSCFERCLERVVGADHVDAHRPHRAREHGVDAGDRGRVHEVRRATNDIGERGQIENVACHECDVRPIGELRAGERVPVEIVEEDDLVVVGEPPRERRADEARAARDHDPLSGQSHAASLARRIV